MIALPTLRSRIVNAACSVPVDQNRALRKGMAIHGGACSSRRWRFLCWKGLRRPSTRRLNASRILPERGVPDPQSDEPEFQHAILQELTTSSDSGCTTGCTSFELVSFILSWPSLSVSLRAALTKIASTPLPNEVEAIFVAMAQTLEGRQRSGTERLTPYE